MTSAGRLEERPVPAMTPLRDVDMRFWLDKADLELKELG